MDGEGRFEWVNAGFERLFGITLEQLIQQKGDNFIDTSNSSDAKDLFLSCIENKITVSYDTFTFDAAGNKIWTQTTLTPIADASGKVIKLVAIDSNITQIKLAEEEIKQQNEEIKAQSEQLKEFNKKRETKNIQIKIGTGDHDLLIKSQKASQFLKEGHRVKFELYLKGRSKFMDRKFHEERLNRVLHLISEILSVSGRKSRFNGFENRLKTQSFFLADLFDSAFFPEFFRAAHNASRTFTDGRNCPR